MSHQDPHDTSQRIIDDPGTLANADHDDLEDHCTSDISNEYLTTEQAMALMWQQMTTPANLKKCCFQREVDCQCH